MSKIRRACLWGGWRGSDGVADICSPSFAFYKIVTSDDEVSATSDLFWASHDCFVVFWHSAYIRYRDDTLATWNSFNSCRGANIPTHPGDSRRFANFSAFQHSDVRLYYTSLTLNIFLLVFDI